MLPLVRQIRAMWRESVAAIEPTKDTRFDPPGAIANLTKVTTRPRTLELTFDARLLPDHDAEALVTAFKEHAERLSSDVFEIAVAVDRNAAGMALPETSPLVAVCSDVLRSLGLDGGAIAKPTSTEAGVFARAGVPAVVLGPSLSKGNAHTANEYAQLDQVERAVDLYTALIRRLCS
jgi:acetylornithine deacetylase